MSCSRAFRKPKNAEERDKFNRECYPMVNMCSDKMVSENFSGMQNGRKNKNPAIKPCTFTTDKSIVQCLDTDIANMTVESLNFWLKNCAKRIVKGNLPSHCIALWVEFSTLWKMQMVLMQ